MQTAVAPLEGNFVKLTVTLDDADFDKALNDAFKKIAKEVRIPGFRPGKAPRRILEQRIGAGYARGVALEDGLPEFYVAAVQSENLDVINIPQLNLLSGAEEGPISFDANVEIRPEVRVPGYEGLQVTIANPKASDAEIEDQLDRMRGGFAVLNEVDRQAQPGDHVRIDVAGTIDGEAVPGLTAEDYLYEVGAGSVVPELDDNLLGSSAGESLNFDAEVPGGDDDSSPIVFDVTVHAVNEKVLPEADDAFAAANSEFSTIAELRADIANRVGMVKRVQSYISLRDQTMNALVEVVDLEEVPQTLLDVEARNRLNDMANRLAQQGATIDQYLAATGQSGEELMAELREQGVNNAKADLALRAVAKAEAMEVSDDEVDAEIVRLAGRFNMKPNQVRRNITNNGQLHVLRADVLKSKALNWLMERVSLVDEDGHAIDRKDIELSAAEQATADEIVDHAEMQGGHDHDPDHDHDHDHDDHEGHDH
jgi:trigger factor